MKEKEPQKPRLLSVKDAAAYLGIGERGVWSMLSRGDLTPVKFGRRSLLDARDLDALVERHKGAAR